MEATKYIAYPSHVLPAYIAEQLNMGILKGFFPVSFIQNQDRCVGAYQVEGYMPVCEWEMMSAEEALQAFRHLLSIMEQLERNYVYPEDYLVNEQTVFLDLHKKCIKLVFQHNQEGIAAKQQLCMLLTSWKAYISEEGGRYLDAMKAFLTSYQAGYRSAIHYCERLLHEVQVCEVS